MGKKEAKRINTPPLEAGSPVLHARGFFFDLGSAQGDSESPSDNGGQSHYSGGQSRHSGGQSRHSGGSSNKARSRQDYSRPSSQVPSRPSSPGGVQWWEADTKHAATGNKSTDKLKSSKRQISPGEPSKFEIELPEHLPSSPLCPKSPLHKSGGTGICVYHGRRRSVRLKKLRRANTEESGEIPN